MKRLVKLFEGFRHRHNLWDVFRDFCELSACAISNSVDLVNAEARESQYMRTVGRYTAEEVRLFPCLLGALVEALNESGPSDVLGQVFCELEITNKDAGQFFTPGSVSALIGQMLVGGDLAREVERKGYVTVHEPAVGGGSMVFGLCRALTEQGLSYQRQLHVTAIDVDLRCVHMAYIQASLLGIPAVVWHGNTLTLRMESAWYTPVHVLHGWGGRLARDREQADRPVAEPCAAEELPVAVQVQGDFGWEVGVGR